MGMKFEFSAVSMQNSGHSDFPAHITIVLRNFLEGLLPGPEHAFECNSLVIPDRIPELGGNREGYQEIWNRQQFLPLPFQPFGGFVVLTLRTTPMAA